MEERALERADEVQTGCGPGHSEKMDIFIASAARSVTSVELREWVLGAFTKQLRKASIGFAVSVCPSVCLE